MLPSKLYSSEAICVRLMPRNLVQSVVPLCIAYDWIDCTGSSGDASDWWLVVSCHNEMGFWVTCKSLAVSARVEIKSGISKFPN